ncbi:hypothetical protein TON_1371 [Thermococcus onnurineus NA1]|uniref:Uncharacterized protein n=1 Tax=Thermococcus onnurineus (strain NA1) TaxID=523850 RepID=B6YXP8_THEON|nr:hypothetical protein TON_1371 [Thermococcus onnurineus NA1]
MKLFTRKVFSCGALPHYGGLRVQEAFGKSFTKSS